MALSATDLYVKYKEDHDLNICKAGVQQATDPLNVHEFHLTRTVDDSKAINNVKTPCIIISASGMVIGRARAASPCATIAGSRKMR